MKILFPISECEPFAKAGGLGDVGSALPSVLINHNIDIRVIIPFYRKVQNFFLENPDIKINKLASDLEVSFDKFYYGMKKVYTFNVFQSYLPNSPKVIIYFIDIPEFFDRPNLYTDDNGIGFPDSAEIFGYFSKAIFEFINSFDWFPDIIHCHDWHTGLIPLFIKHSVVSLNYPVKTIFTIHNMAYQGTFAISYAEKFGLDSNVSLMKDLVSYDKINYLKAGIVSADRVSTVSRTYRDELLTSEYGNGLESFLEARKESFYGILNGVDYEAWDPVRDNYISSKYSSTSIEGKKLCKDFLWEFIKNKNKNFSFENATYPIFVMVSRLDKQKGIDLVAHAIPDLKNEKLHLIIVGSGNKKLETQLQEYNKLPYFTFVRDFSNRIAHQMEAGADFFLMPSRYEPCGLNQMYSLKYGTFPIVRKTGGLADTVKDLDSDPNGNGFVFEEYSSEALLKTILRAIQFYNTTDLKKIDEIRSKIMLQNFSWDESVKKYIQLYQF